MKQALSQGRPLPSRIAAAPELSLGLELYYAAFWELSSCRPVGLGGVGGIPWSVMMDYARAYDLDEEQTQDLLELVRSLDVAYLEWKSKQKD